MWSSRPYIPPAPLISGERDISGERAGLEFWFTLATLAGRSDTSTRQPALFAESGLGRATTTHGARSAQCDLGEHLAEHAVAIRPDPLGPLLVARLEDPGGAA